MLNPGIAGLIYLCFFFLRNINEHEQCHVNMSYGWQLTLLILFYHIRTVQGFLIISQSVDLGRWNVPVNRLVLAYRQTSLKPADCPRKWTMLPPTSGLSTEGTYLVRILFLRALAFVHWVAFFVALRQNKALLGDEGLTPARHVLEQATARGTLRRTRRLVWRKEMKQRENEERQAGRILRKLPLQTRIQQAVCRRLDQNASFVRIREVLWDRSDHNGRPTTTLLWLAKDRNKLNPWLDGIALTGLAMSSFIFIKGAANVPLVFALWLIQKSLMNVGGVWYGYGWEPQLAELSFHSIFLVPLLNLDPLKSTPISPLVQWTIKWHLFRIMVGAGLIKVKAGDPKWKDWTATCYFYETQPVPNPISRYIHWMPRPFHKFEVGVNHLVELVAPWFLILPGLPTGVRRMSGLLQMAFQVVIIITGNLSFLNWLTMVPAIMCLDDALLGEWFAPSYRLETLSVTGIKRISLLRRIVDFLFFALIVKLSVPVVKNLLSRKQIMNASYDPLRLVNSYGAFGRVGKVREEWIISARTENGEWKEYEFKVKPGDVTRPPRFLSPYHHRLDWQMWLAANLKDPHRSEWIFSLLLKLLQGDPGVRKLLAFDPFAYSEERPKYIKIDAYRYQFHRPARGEKSPPYWERSYIRQIFPLQGQADIQACEAWIRRKNE